MTSSEVSSSSVHMDAFRGLAALVVFIGHSRDMFLGSSAREWIQKAGHSSSSSVAAVSGPAQAYHPSIAHLAVMVFFVLSGFLVGGSVLRAIRGREWSWKKYLFQRMTRLWIVLIPALVIGYAIDMAGIHYSRGRETIYQSPSGQQYVHPDLAYQLSPLVLAGNVLFLQEIAVPAMGCNPALWSLAYEFWYYIAFPLLALSLVRRRNWISRMALLFLLAAVLVFTGSHIAVYFLIWLLGVSLHFVPQRIPLRILTPYLILTLFALVATVILVQRLALGSFGSDSLVALSFSFMLYGVLHQSRPSRKGIYRSMAQFLSRMSYTLYATQLPLLIFASALLMHPWHRWPVSARNVAAYFLVFWTVFTLCYLTYRCFEANTGKIRRLIWNYVLEPARRETAARELVSR